MRRDVVQQLRSDNATDWAVALGVPLLALLFCGIAAITGLDQTARDEGSDFAGAPASIFCGVIFSGSVLLTFFAAWTMRNHTCRILMRHSEQLLQQIQESAMPQASTPDPDVVSSDAAAELASSPARAIRELGLHFGTWSLPLREGTAPLAFRVLKVAFNTLVVIVWLLGPLLMPNVSPPQPTILPAGVLLWTLCGYLSFNMGYRIGVRHALRANLKLLGVDPTSGAVLPLG
jgi:hypothetical protein